MISLGESSGAKLAQAHAGRFRIVTYSELRTKATAVAADILKAYGADGRGVVLAPVLMGGALPGRLIADALLGAGIIRDIMPCHIKRYTGLGEAGEARVLISLPRTRIRGRIVIAVDDLVDGGQTLAAFRRHALAQGAREVNAAVIYAKPWTTEVPRFVGETGVTEWLVLPGEELDFMGELAEVDPDVAALSLEEQQVYFEALGMVRGVAEDWVRLRRELPAGVQ